MIKYVLLAILATPIQAQESLPQCQTVAERELGIIEAEGYVIVDVKQFPDALMFIYSTPDGLHDATLLITPVKEGYSPKGNAKVVKEGDCLLGETKAYWGVAKKSDGQARAEQ
jgi:hypothetical protein